MRWSRRSWSRLPRNLHPPRRPSQPCTGASPRAGEARVQLHSRTGAWRRAARRLSTPATPGRSSRPSRMAAAATLDHRIQQLQGQARAGRLHRPGALGEAKAEQLLKIEAGQVYKPVFVLNAGTLIIRPRPSEGAEVSDGATVIIEYPGGTGPATNYGETKIVLPAGEQKLTVKIGQGEATETIHARRRPDRREGRRSSASAISSSTRSTRPAATRSMRPA